MKRSLTSASGNLMTQGRADRARREIPHTIITTIQEEMLISSLVASYMKIIFSLSVEGHLELEIMLMNG